MKRLLCLCVLVGLFPRLPVALATLGTPSVEDVRSEFLTTAETGRKTEVYWTKPKGNGPWPALILIHGHQFPVRNGGLKFVQNGTIMNLAQKGLAVFSVSQPGYGNSEGQPDFCGKFSQDAVLGLIEWIRSKAFIRKDKIGIFGYSRGAIVAGMVAARNPNLALAILGGGIYDLKSAYANLDEGIKRSIQDEAGTSDQAFKERSAALNLEKYSVRTVVVHAEKDEASPFILAKKFSDELAKKGVLAKFISYPDANHSSIPPEVFWADIQPFLQKFLLD